MSEISSFDKNLKIFSESPLPASVLRGLKKLKEIFLRQSSPGSWILGLDQGTSALRYVVWDKKAGRLIQFGQFEMERQDASGGKSRADAATLLRDLVRAMPKNRLCGIHMNVQGGPLLLGFMEIAAGGKNVQPSVLRHSLRSHLPFPPEEAALIYHERVSKSAKPQEGGHKTLVSYAACHKPVIVQMVRNIQNIFGLVPDVTTQGYAQEALLHFLDLAKPGELAAVISGGRSITSISIVKDGRLLFEREIPLAGQDITRSIFITHLQGQTLRSAEDLKIAEQLKKKSAIPAEDAENEAENQRLFQAMHGVLAAWIQDIRLSFAYFNEHYDATPIRHVFLAGGMANHKNLTAHLNHELGMEVRILVWPETRAAALAHIRHAEVFQENFHEYVTALGLALKPGLRSSLTPREFQAADWTQIWQAFLRVFALLGAVFLISAFAFLQAKEARLISVKQTVDTHRHFLKMLEGPYQEMLRWENLLGRAEFPAPPAGDFLQMLSRMTPADLLLQGLFYNRESGDIWLEGLIYGDPKRRAVIAADFSRIFKRDPRFRNVEMPLWESGTSDADKGHFRLTLQCKIPGKVNP